MWEAIIEMPQNGIFILGVLNVIIEGFKLKVLMDTNAIIFLAGGVILLSVILMIAAYVIFNFLSHRRKK